MSVNNVIDFFKRMEEDEVFREEVLKDESLDPKNSVTFLAMAKEKGYDFTMEDLEEAKKSMEDTQLSDKDLESVSGGQGYGVCFMLGYGKFKYKDPIGKEHEPNSDRPNSVGPATGLCLVYGINVF